MDAKELRIGNYVCDAKLKIGIKFTSLYGLCNVETKPDDFKPIPLTEDWLLRLGFTKIGVNYELGKSFELYSNVNGGLHFRYDYRRTQIEHVHQLQNLYFSLSGEELTIKDN